MLIIEKPALQLLQGKSLQKEELRDEQLLMFIDVLLVSPLISTHMLIGLKWALTGVSCPKVPHLMPQ
jgi:hypothetical protein